MAMGKMGNHYWILSRRLHDLTFILISSWMLCGQWTAEGLLEGEGTFGNRLSQSPG